MQNRQRNAIIGNPIIAEALASLRDGRELLEDLSDETYGRALPPIFNHGIGSHVRHILDFYSAFFLGLENGRIDYDRRERDRQVEKIRLSAMAKVDDLSESLRRLQPADLALPLLVRLEDTAVDEPIWSQSTGLRELQFLQSHTVHHYALIALMLRLQGVVVNEAFGVASSTLKQWRAA
jgi:uncharacterized damage-inducible protein DinB